MKETKMSELNNIVKAAYNGNPLDVKSNFQTVISDKLRDIIDTKRQEIAMNMFNTNVDSVETTDTEQE